MIKSLPKNYIYLIILLGLVSSLIVFLCFTNDGQILTTNHSAQVDSRGLPVQLKITSLNVEAPIEYVGVNSTGAMDVPKAKNDVAWYNLGPRPGKKGSAVIAGHLDWKDGTPAVFTNLDKLSTGDRIEILDDQGKSMTFVVRESRIYKSNADATEIFTSQTGVHLNLITCSGDWNKSKNTYNDRLVVFTDLVDL